VREKKGARSARPGGVWMCCISRSPGSLKKAPKRQVQIFPKIMYDRIALQKSEKGATQDRRYICRTACVTTYLPNKLEVINKPARLEIGWKRRHKISTMLLPYKTAFQRQGKGTARDWPSGLHALRRKNLSSWLDSTTIKDY
jgi:hypothetical protein